MPRVLIIDDNPAIREALRLLLSLRDIDSVDAETPEAGLAVLAQQPLDLVIADMNFSADTTSGEEGVALFRAIRERHPDLPVMLLTAWTHLETAVELVKAGAADYLAKPWDDDKLLTTVGNLLELSEANRTVSRLAQVQRQRRAELERRYALNGLVFVSDAMLRVVELACKVAPADVPVLITGPNGAGKDRIAQIIHANSAVAQGPFVALNCGALPADLIEAELFGAEAGAYTGANRAREGRFEAANGGTLFLDEIGNLPLSGQMKLLRVLETGHYERLGSTQTRRAQVRVISATNADLNQMIEAGRFRQDLYYRLNLIEIALPPLIERSEDILPLAESFVTEDTTLADDAREALIRYSWPGNVRELRNALKRARLLSASGMIHAADLNLPALAGAPRSLEDPDRDTIVATLKAHGGNISRSAQALGLSRQALYRRMERHKLDT